jgi:hypothetical protein
MASLDTLEIAKRLRSAGFSEQQAEAITGAMRATPICPASRQKTILPCCAPNCAPRWRYCGAI